MDWPLKITQWHKEGFWTADMVRSAVTKGKLTAAQCDAILTARVTESGNKNGV